MRLTVQMLAVAVIATLMAACNEAPVTKASSPAAPATDSMTAAPLSATTPAALRRAPEWQYRIENIPDLEFSSKMGALGKDGWELVFARRASDRITEKMEYEVILKRLVLPGNTDAAMKAISAETVAEFERPDSQPTKPQSNGVPAQIANPLPVSTAASVESSGPRATVAGNSATPSDIRDFCAQKWPDKYEMQEYCQKGQTEAKAKIDGKRNGSVPITVFNRIRSQCFSKWGPNYEMREYCESNEMRAFGNIND